ncbi:MAG: hypothetical protein NTZ73_03030 [Candidatus Diapherotrites archaeon]|nr:hypothetical protein [Candidatus Diapherotrites archaeon]
MVNGGWSGWSYGGWGNVGGCGSYQSCKQRQDRALTRSCNNPSPACSGAGCSGSSSTTETQYLSCGSVNGGWSGWSNNGGCSSCVQNQVRSCNNPAPACSGAACSGSSSQNVSCGSVAGGWSGFGSWHDTSGWGACSGCLQYKSQQRDRNCTNPSPVCGGAACSGLSYETRSISQSCGAVNGGWSGWSDSGTCGQYVACKQREARACNNPSPVCGGAACSGSSTQDVKPCGQGICSPGSPPQTQICGRCGTQSRSCNNTCGWSNWGPCTGETGICSIGEKKIGNEECGICGFQWLVCDGSCLWGNGNCEEVGCGSGGSLNCPEIGIEAKLAGASINAGTGSTQLDFNVDCVVRVDINEISFEDIQGQPINGGSIDALPFGCSKISSKIQTEIDTNAEKNYAINFFYLSGKCSKKIYFTITDLKETSNIPDSNIAAVLLALAFVSVILTGKSRK